MTFHAASSLLFLPSPSLQEEIELVEEVDYPNGVEIDYHNGDKYYGEIDQHTKKRNGQGRMIYSNENSQTYVGSWKDNFQHGQGTLTDDSGNCYKGGWHMSQQAGYGRQVYSNGDIYEGRWQQGKKNGQGKIIWSVTEKNQNKKSWDTRLSSGLFVNDKMWGLGIDESGEEVNGGELRTTSASRVGDSVGETKSNATIVEEAAAKKVSLFC